MARRAGSIFVTTQDTPWAGETGALLVELVDAAGGALTVASGLPTAFNVDRYIQAGIYNRVNNYLWDTLIDIGQHGILEHHDNQQYAIHARVVGSDGIVYRAVQANTGQDPTTDTSNTYWIADEIAAASDTEVEAGSDSVKSVTPSGLLSLFKAAPNARWRAVNDRFGLARLATIAEVDAASSNDRVVTPASLRRNLLAPLHSPQLTGIPHAPTQPNSNNSTRLATTAFVKTSEANLRIGENQIQDGAVTGDKLGGDVDIGPAYIHVATANSIGTTQQCEWTIESGGSTYVAYANAGNVFNLAVKGNAPRGLIKFIGEVYEGNTFRGRISVPIDGNSHNGLIISINPNGSILRGFNISAGSQSQPVLAGNLQTRYRASLQGSAQTGWSCRFFAVVKASDAVLQLDGGNVVDGAITTRKIADGAVTQDKLAAGITLGGMMDTVATDDIDDEAVTRAKIADMAVGENQLADDAVTEDKIEDFAVTRNKLATFSVDDFNVRPAAITTTKIADGAVTQPKLANDAVGTNQLEDDSVTANKLAPGAVVSYVHLSTAPSRAETGNTRQWNWGNIESGAEDYALINPIFPYYLHENTIRPRGVVGYMGEIYQGAVFIGRFLFEKEEGTPMNFMVSDSPRRRINYGRQSTSDANSATGRGPQMVVWWDEGGTTGYELRVYAITLN